MSSTEPHRSVVRYPGGLTVRYRWGGPGSFAQVFALSESGGALVDLGAIVSPDPDRLCRAEMRVEGPAGVWTARFASPIFDGPTAFFWDVPALLVVKYGFAVYGLASRTGSLRWTHTSGTPLLDVLGSSRLDHVIAQSEVESIALRSDGETTWRIAHSDVVADAEILGGRLILRSYGGLVSAYDASTGETLG